MSPRSNTPGRSASWSRNRIVAWAVAAILTMTAGEVSVYAAPYETAAPQKVALVIGNAGYDGADRLQSPLRDAKLIGQTLSGLGFETHVALDVSFDEFRNQVNWLSSEARTASVVLFYFAGHGFESEGDNFLVPVHTGVPIAAMSHASLLSHGIRLDAVRAAMRSGGPAVVVSLVDACRVPARGAGARPLKGDGAPRGEIIGYSTSDHGVAYDSIRTFGIAADDSPFAYFLASNLRKPGATIKQALEHTQQQVVATTEGGQQPWIASGLNGDFAVAGNDVQRPSASVEGLHNVPRTAQTRKQIATRGATADAQLAERQPANGGADLAVGPGGRVDTTAANGNSPGDADADATWAKLDAQITDQARRADDAGIARLRGQAAHGDVIALTTLGLYYADGRGGPSRPKSAIELYRKAAVQHFPIAQTLLAEAYVGGQLVPVDLNRAESLLAQASNAGYQRAKLDLLDLRMRRGQGTKGDNLHDVANELMKQFQRATASSSQ
jgi:uncharacterized caspase-like protein